MQLITSLVSGHGFSAVVSKRDGVLIFLKCINYTQMSHKMALNSVYIFTPQ